MTPEDPTPEPRRIPSILLPGALALLLIALLATSAALWLGRSGSIDDGAVVAARQEAINFFSLDYKHADRDIARVLQHATGSFKRQYAAQRTALVQQMTANKVVLSATVPTNGAATEYFHGDVARILVAIDVTTTVGAAPPQQSRYRTRVELTRVSNTWLITAVSQVG